MEFNPAMHFETLAALGADTLPMLPAQAGLIAQLLPAAELSFSRTIAIGAARPAVFRALKQLSLADLPALRRLLAACTLGGSELKAALPIFERLAGCRSALAQEEPNREAVFAFLPWFWGLDGGFLPVRSQEMFASFTRPECGKAALSFRLAEIHGGTALTVTLWLQLPPRPAAARLARAYWQFAVQIGFAALARFALAAIKRRAEGEPTK